MGKCSNPNAGGELPALICPERRKLAAVKVAKQPPGRTRPPCRLVGASLRHPRIVSVHEVGGKASAKHGLLGRCSDVYSLRAILFYLLTGSSPFVAETISDTIHLVLKAEPITPRTLVLGIPRELETICLNCPQKEQATRYATAQELAADLGHYLNHGPIQARGLPNSKSCGGGAAAILP